MGWHFPWVTSLYSNFLNILWWNMQGEKYSGLSRHLWVILDCFFYLQIEIVTKGNYLKAVAVTEVLIQRVIKAHYWYIPALSTFQVFRLFLPPTYTHFIQFIYCISPSFAIWRHASFPTAPRQDAGFGWTKSNTCPSRWGIIAIYYCNHKALCTMFTFCFLVILLCLFSLISHQI